MIFFILGDSGYPLRPIMMTPVSDPEPGSPEEYYQNMHLTTKTQLNGALDFWKDALGKKNECSLKVTSWLSYSRHWLICRYCLQMFTGKRKLHYSPTVAARITNACCVLHNIANRHNLPFKPLTTDEAEAECRRQEGDSGSTLAIRGCALALCQLELGRARRHALIQRLWANRAVEN